MAIGFGWVVMLLTLAPPAAAVQPDTKPSPAPVPVASTPAPRPLDPEQEKRLLLLRARLMDPAIVALVEAGGLERREAELRRTLDRAAPDKAHWAAAAESLSQILVLTRRAKEAEPLARRAVAARERLRNQAAHGKALIHLTEALNESYDAKAGELVARRAILVLTPLSPERELLARAWAQLGASIANQNLPGEAVRATQTALEIARSDPKTESALIAAIEAELKGRQAGLAVNVKAEADTRAKIDQLTKSGTLDGEDAAKAQEYLARVLGAQGRYEDAIQAGNQAVAIRRRIEGKADSKPLDTRIALRLVEELTRRKLIAEATAQGVTFGAAQTSAGAVPAPTKAASSYSRSEIEAMLAAAQFAEAEPILRARLAASGAKDRAYPPAAADDLELLGQLLSSTGGSSEAARLLQQLVALREQAGEPIATARAYWRLAYALNGASASRAAETAARRAIAIATPLAAWDVPLAAAYGELGASLAAQRRRPEAGIAFQKAVDIATEKKASGDLIADYRNNLALNLQQTGNLEEAGRIYRRNLDALIENHGRGHIETARTLSLLATNLERQRQRDEAELALIEAIAIRERVLGSRNPATIGSLANYVGLLARSQRNAEALEFQERVTQLRATLPETSAADQVMDLGQMGAILENRKQIDASIEYRRRALALARRRLDPGHPNIAIATRALAVALLMRDETDPEYVTLMRGAVAEVRRDRMRALLGEGAPGSSAADRALSAALSDTGRLNSNAVDIYRNALGLNGTFATNVRSEEPRMRAESFLIAQDLATTETGRASAAIALRESLGDTPRGRLVRRQQDLATRLRALNRDLIEAADSDPAAAGKIRATIEASSQELARADADLQKAFPDYVRLVAPDALSADEVRKRLKPGEGLLLIVKTDYYTMSFAVTPDAFDWSASQTVFNEDRTAIARVRCDVDPLTCPSDMKPSPSFDRVTAHELYRQLVQPLAATLNGVKTLYVTTSGDLADLPFPALITAKPEGPDSDAALLATPWLSDRYALISLPSVAALRAGAGPQTAPVQAVPFVGYGAPSLAAPGPARAIPAGLAPAAAGVAPELADTQRLAQLPSLPGTTVELTAMAGVLGAGADSIHLGASATEAAVRGDPDLGRARIIAFATHGLLPGELEGYAEPGLVFTPPALASAADDGVLSASEAAAMQLSAEWVILSACNTATAEGSGGGDALSALARAFLYAGADALLASRWRVGDEVTAALTVETLTNARADPQAGRASALQAAMRAVRTGKRGDGRPVKGWNPSWAHPASWAPFSLIANGN